MNLALSLQARKQFKKALLQYDATVAILKTIPGSEKLLATAEILRASLHYKTKKTEAAKAALQRAQRLLQLQPHDPATIALLESQLGRAHFRAGETEKALSYLDSAAGLWGQIGNSWMLADTLSARAKIIGERRSK